MSIISIENLKKSYRDSEVTVQALDDITLSFEKAEFTAIVGPSGSGKTTLLNMIGGLDKPDSGKIMIGGEDITALSARKLVDFRLNNIGFVFQSYNLIPVLTALENVEFILQMQGEKREAREQRAMELLGSVGLGERVHSRPSKLSGGQQQRVAVARALASRPRFILADEPTANLDSQSTKNLLEIMEKLNHGEQITFIFSTHDQRVVNKAHRVIVLEDGKVVKDELRDQEKQ
jgi:putative ABC transport system ATP-binding protein